MKPAPGRLPGPVAGFTKAKPCALLKLDFLTSEFNKCTALVRKSSFSKAQGQGLRETGPQVQARGGLSGVHLHDKT